MYDNTITSNKCLPWLHTYQQHGLVVEEGHVSRVAALGQRRVIHTPELQLSGRQISWWALLYIKYDLDSDLYCEIFFII